MNRAGSQWPWCSSRTIVVACISPTFDSRVAVSVAGQSSFPRDWRSLGSVDENEPMASHQAPFGPTCTVVRDPSTSADTVGQVQFGEAPVGYAVREPVTHVWSTGLCVDVGSARLEVGHASDMPAELPKLTEGVAIQPVRVAASIRLAAGPMVARAGSRYRRSAVSRTSPTSLISISGALCPR